MLAGRRQCGRVALLHHRRARSVAEQVNKLDRFDAIITPASAIAEPQRIEVEPTVFAVNVLAPYILTALIQRPATAYLSSGMHQDDLLWTKRSWSGSSAYAESKLCDVLLAFAVARRWPNVLSNALEPGGGADEDGGRWADMSKAHLTQAGLAVSDDRWRGRAEIISITSSFGSEPIARDVKVQDQLISATRLDFRHRAPRTRRTSSKRGRSAGR